MADAQDVSPVVYRKFSGVDNVHSPWELETHELSICTNYDITTKGKLVQRVGRTSKLTGGYTNLWTNGTIILANRSGSLVSISPEFTSYNILRTGIGSNLSYADCNGKVVWTDGIKIEYIENGYSHTFETPTDFGKYPLPAGDIIQWYKGCLWIAKGRTVWQSDPFVTRIGSMPKTNNSRQFQGNIVLLQAVEDGMWFGDNTGIYHAGGRSLTDMNILTKVTDYPAIKGMVCKIDGKLLSEPLQDVTCMIGTERGISIIGNAGLYKSITEDKMAMPSGTKGTMVFNNDPTGLSKTIAVINNV